MNLDELKAAAEAEIATVKNTDLFAESVWVNAYDLLKLIAVVEAAKLVADPECYEIEMRNRKVILNEAFKELEDGHR